MKKVLKSAMVIAASALLLVSCKEEDATPVPSASQFGTVSGFVFYDNDQTGEDDDENDDVPVGATIQITTFSEPDGDGGIDFTSGSASVATTTIGADGSYSFTIPTNSGGAEYELEIFDYAGSISFEVTRDSVTSVVEEEGFYAGTNGPSGQVFPTQTNFEGITLLGGFTSNDPASQFIR